MEELTLYELLLTLEIENTAVTIDHLHHTLFQLHGQSVECGFGGVIL
jgi:hypothetical protein